MRLLFICTGGTIGSTVDDNGTIATEPSKFRSVIKRYSDKYGINFDYDVVEPYSELSENNTGNEIRMLTMCVKKKLDDGFDGIIVTHGTDTLQYTAAALGYMLGADSLPVCIVSSNRPAENSDSNALDNLHGAVNFIKCRGGNGVFVPYRNGNGNVVKVHRATRLIGAKAFSDDVSSIKGAIYGCFDGDFKFIKNEVYTEKRDEMPTLDLSALSETCNGIAVLSVYPGMVYPIINEGVRYIILNTYHSGTLNTKSQDTKDFAVLAKKMGVTVYVTGISDGPQYESAKLYDELGFIPLVNISPVAAYVKLWILTQSGRDVKRSMSLSLAGDIMPNRIDAQIPNKIV